ncbi:hypothetical protein BH11GEM1_BH11GEM1_31710 [soil metagenome]
MSAHERMYRLLLRAYPEGFRSAYGREMEQVFRDQCREAAKRDVRLWAETVWDVVQSAPALRMEATRAGWYEDIHAKEGKMKTMASLAMLIGAVVVASALAEGWAGGVVNHDGRSLMAGMLGVVAGALLLAAGIGLLRDSRRAAMRAQGAAVTCLGVFALITLAAPRMAVLTTLLGFGFPVALLLYLRRRQGQGPSAPTMAALVFALSFCAPARSPAQAPARDATRSTLEGKDLPLTAVQRQSYVGRYETELPGGEKVTMRIFEENGALRLWVSNPDESRRLFYQGDNVFLLENAPAFVLTFNVVNDAAVKFTVRKPEGELVAVRIG